LFTRHLGGQARDLDRHLRAEFAPPGAAANHEGNQWARQMGEDGLPFRGGLGQHIRRHAMGGGGDGQGVDGRGPVVVGGLGDQVEIPCPRAWMHDMNQFRAAAGQFLDPARGGGRAPPGADHQVRPGRCQQRPRWRRDGREGRPQQRVVQTHQGAVFNVLPRERQAQDPGHPQALAAVAGPVVGQHPDPRRISALLGFGHRPLMAWVPRPGNGSVLWRGRRCI